MDRNKKLDHLPEDETKLPYECISMDGFHTPAGENGLAIIDRHTRYVWAEKTGDIATGTADVRRKECSRKTGSKKFTVAMVKT